MKNAQLEEVLFDKFLEMLESKGIKPQGGILVDGTFVEVPRQHHTKVESEQLKKGEIPQEFKSNPHWLAQKECEGNWAKKGIVRKQMPKRPIRFFNTTGPCNPDMHYMLPSVERLQSAQLHRYPVIFD